MAFRKVWYLIPSCDGCGLAWAFFDPACAEGIPPHFAGKTAALEQLPRDYGWQVHPRRLGRSLMACRTCAAAGVIPAGASRGWPLAAAGWVRRLVPFGPVRRPLRPHPGPQHPESLAAELTRRTRSCWRRSRTRTSRNREGEPEHEHRTRSVLGRRRL